MDTVFERAKDLREKVETLMLKKVEWGVLFSVNGQRTVSDIADKVGRDEDVVKTILKKLAEQKLISGDTSSLGASDETTASKVKKEEKEPAKAKKAKAKKETKEVKEVKEVKDVVKEAPVTKAREPEPVAEETDLMGSLTEAPKPEPKPAVVTKAPAAAAVAGGRKILVVDDSIVIQKMVEIALENETYQLTSAMKGEEAIKSAKDLQPGLILLDIMLPDMSGLDVMKAIRELGGTFEKIPIIILSGKDSHQDKDVALSNGANDFLTKPFHDEDLIAKVHEYIGK